MGNELERQLRRAQTDRKMCEHEVERMRAQHQADLAEIKRLKRYIHDLETKLGRLRTIEHQIDELRRKHLKRERPR